MDRSDYADEGPQVNLVALPPADKNRGHERSGMDKRRRATGEPGGSGLRPTKTDGTEGEGTKGKGHEGIGACWPGGLTGKDTRGRGLCSDGRKLYREEACRG
ncbi:MAG: hypothetical protein J1F16_09140 [Muribaculaceae bacterium]|nr:hypothetical protein [Muribaculaceae bacterium]